MSTEISYNLTFFVHDIFSECQIPLKHCAESFVAKASSPNLKRALQTCEEVLNEYYFLTRNKYLDLIVDLIKAFQELRQSHNKNFLHSNNYDGSFFNINEGELVRQFYKEFADQTVNDKDYNDLRRWIQGAKQRGPGNKFSVEHGAMFRNSEILRLMMSTAADVAKFVKTLPIDTPGGLTEEAQKLVFDYYFSNTDSVHPVTHKGDILKDDDHFRQILGDNVMYFRKLMMISNGDRDAVTDFIRTAEKVYDGEVMEQYVNRFDIIQSLESYLQQNPDKCPGTKEIIVDQRLGHYKTERAVLRNLQLARDELTAPKDTSGFSSEFREYERAPSPSFSQASDNTVQEDIQYFEPYREISSTMDSDTMGMVIAGAIVVGIVAVSSAITYAFVK